MKNYIKIISIASFFLVSAFYSSPAFAAGCTSNEECTTGNCVAGQCYDSSIGSPCLSDSVCANKNCYAGRCCPETYPMGGTCPKKTTAKVIPDIMNIDNSVSGGTQTLDDPSKGEDTKDVETADTGMRFSGMTGQVEYLLPGKDPEDENNWKLAKLKDAYFPPGTHIRTQEDSSAILSFSDMSTFVLKPESHVVVTTPPKKESKLKMVAGNIWVNVKNMVENGSMAIEMNQAVAGIKGTTFVLQDIGGKSSIKVIEGVVEFTGKIDGKKQSVTAGEALVADVKGLGTKTTFDVSEESKIWAEVEDIATGKTTDSQKTSPLWYVIPILIIAGFSLYYFKK